MKAKSFAALAAVLLFAAVAQAAEIILPTIPDTKEMIVSVCYYKEKTTFVPKGNVPDGVVKLGESFAKEFIENSRKDGFKTVDVGTCVVKDDPEGRINIILKIMGYPRLFGTIDVIGEASFKAPGEEKGLASYSAFLNLKGQTPETAALEVWRNFKGKIDRAPKMVPKPSQQVPETETRPVGAASG